MTATRPPRIHGRDAIVVEADYPQSIETVWRALTDPALVGQWLMTSDFEPRLGHRFSFRTKPAPGFSGIIECVVDEFDPPHRLGYTWWGGGGNPQTHVRFDLASLPTARVCGSRTPASRPVGSAARSSAGSWAAAGGARS